jgi:hypothetical protein
VASHDERRKKKNLIDAKNKEREERYSKISIRGSESVLQDYNYDFDSNVNVDVEQSPECGKIIEILIGEEVISSGIEKRVNIKYQITTKTINKEITSNKCYSEFIKLYQNLVGKYADIVPKLPIKFMLGSIKTEENSTVTF